MPIQMAVNGQSAPNIRVNWSTQPQRVGARLRGALAIEMSMVDVWAPKR